MFSLPKPLRLVVSLALFTGAMLLALLLSLSSPNAVNAQTGPSSLGTASQAAGWGSSHWLAPQPRTVSRTLSAAIGPGSMLPAQEGPAAQSPSDTPQARVNVTYDSVDGSFGPGATVQFTVTTSGGTPKGGGQGTAGPDGWMNGTNCNCDIQPGDRVHVTSNLGFDAVLAPIAIGGKIDAKNDLVSGQMSGGIFPGAGFVWVWSDSRQQGSGQSITIAGDGKYSAPFTGRFDIMAGDKADVWYNDAHGNQVGATFDTPHARVNVTYDSVDGSFGPSATVQFTVTTSGGTPKGGGQGTAGPDGRLNGTNCNCDIQPGDRVRVTSNLGFDAVLEPITIGGKIDAENDLVSGQMSGGIFPGTGFVDVSSASGQKGAGQSITIAGDGKYSASFAGRFDIMAGDRFTVWYNDANGNQVGATFEPAQARVNVTYDNVDGSFGPGATVQFTVTTSGGTPKGGGQGTARPDGRLNGTNCNCDIQPGDRVHVTSNLGFDAVLVPITIGGKIDAKNDLVSGQMSGGVFPGSGFVSVYSDSRQQGSGQSITIDADGKYSAPFTGRFDIMAGDKADVWYNDANGNQVGAELFTLRFDVNYGHDWVQTQGSPGTQVTVTLVGKGSVTGLIDANGWYNTPRLQDWTPPVNDIAPGDAISVTDGSSSTEVNPIGRITGRAILGQDVVVGNVYAPWYASPLAVRCEVWVNNGPQPVQTMVQPDGGSYQCDFKTVGWHIVSGQDIAIRYVQPDGNSVINVFRAQEYDLFLPLVRGSH